MLKMGKKAGALILAVFIMGGLFSSAAFAEGMDASDIEKNYKKTTDLTDEDKSDSTQKNYQKADGSTQESYFYKSAEWTDKANGKARITLTADLAPVTTETTAVYVMDTCTVHGFSKELASANLKYLLDNYDHVDVLFVTFDGSADAEGTDGTDRVTAFSDVQNTDCLDQVTFGPGRHAASDVASALETYLFGSHGSTTQVKSPTAVFVSLDDDIGFDKSTMPAPETDAFWNLLKSYDDSKRYFSMGSCDRSVDDIADTSGRIADPSGYSEGTLPEFISKNANLTCAVSNNNIVFAASDSKYDASVYGDNGTLTGVNVNGSSVSFSEKSASGSVSLIPTLTADAEGTYGGKYKVSVTSTDISLAILEDVLPDTITLSYQYGSNTGNSLNSLYYEVSSIKINGTPVDLDKYPSDYLIENADVNTAYDIEAVGTRKLGLYHGTADFLYTQSIEDALGKTAVITPPDATISDTVADNFDITSVSTNDADLTAVKDGNNVKATYIAYPGGKVLQVYIDVVLRDKTDEANLDKWLDTNSGDAVFDYKTGKPSVSSPMLYYGDKTTSKPADISDKPASESTDTSSGTSSDTSSKTSTTKTGTSGTTVTSTTKTVTAKGSVTESPKTGDANDIILWIALAAISGVVLIGGTICRKNDKKNQKEES